MRKLEELVAILIVGVGVARLFGDSWVALPIAFVGGVWVGWIYRN